MADTTERTAPGTGRAMPPPAPPTPAPTADVLDDLSEKLAAFNVLRKSDQAAADAILDQLGGHGPVEQDIVRELAIPRPLYLCDRFEQAHRLAMKSLEVLRRNGWRQARLPRNLGPLRPVAAWVVQLFTRLIVQNYVSNIVDALHNLYGRREAWTVPGSPESHMLRRGRYQLERLSQGYKGRALGLPTFLLGGAVISGALSALRAAAQSVAESVVLAVIATLVLLGLMLGAAWCVLRAAGVARHRIRLTTDPPLKALYQTIGACGNPPKDQALQFALYSLIGMALAWIVLPLALILIIRL